jgi:hypothetical protein
MFIKKLELTADVEQINRDLDHILTLTSWGVENQIGLTHRKIVQGDIWKDCVGSLYNRETGEDIANESEFTEINSAIPRYLLDKIQELAVVKNFKLGRVRLMRLMSKAGLTVHADTSVRYHLVLQTNPTAYMAQAFRAGNIGAVCFHMPADGYFYKVDTTKHHFVYNGGLDPRIHLVICPI